MPPKRTPSSSSNIRIVIAEPMRINREALERVFAVTPGFQVVGTAKDSKETLQCVGKQRPDVVILEAPGLASHERVEVLVKGINNLSPHTGILMVTTTDDIHALQAALRAGITNYTSKHEELYRLFKATRRAAEHGSYFSPCMVGVLVQASHSQHQELNPRETDLLRLLGMGHTNAEIAERLHLSVRTVEANRGSLQDKLGMTARHQLTREALDRNLLS